jgi:2-haloacid dehalogenase
MSLVVVFDVNGTLLDPHALARPLRRIFGCRISVQEWFTKVLQYSMAVSLAADYVKFSEIATTVLEMEAAGKGIGLNKARIEKLQSAMEHLPAFPDVKSSLRKLRNANVRLATLTNSSPSTLDAQLRNSGLDRYFEQTLSVQSVHRYKPSAETYRFAAQSLGIDPREILMVAAHPWDLLGASRVGCRTAFVSRPGKALWPSARRPDYVVEDLAELADRLIGETSFRPQSTHGASAKWLAVIGCGAALGVVGRILVRENTKVS